MDTSRLLLLIFMVIAAFECSGSDNLPIEDYDEERYSFVEGESLYFVPYALKTDPLNKNFTWFRTTSDNKIENITTDENESVHHHGGVLLLLNPLTKDSGYYTGRRYYPSGQWSNYYVEVNIYKPSPTIDSRLIYGGVENSDQNKKVECPALINKICTTLKGNFTWNKDSKPLEGQHEAVLWIKGATKSDDDIYTCICTWTHNGKEYNSSGSRSVKHEDTSSHRVVEILSPTDKEQIAEEGVGIKLNCSVFCGINVKPRCNAIWHFDGAPPNRLAGYHQTTNTVNEEPSEKTISTATLTIDKVSAEDFKAKFKCIGRGLYTNGSTTLTLKPRESIMPLVVGGVCVFLFCVFAAALVKCFAIDLALFFRSCFPLSRCHKDGRLFDAYVVYQMQNADKVTEDALCQFVAKVLPFVLEEKCGYRLFIHGRDDIPGEDRLELVEDRMKQSRRLMVILTPGSGSESETSDQHPVSPQNPVVGGFDWQVGLHHALMQREMSVILIQLGDEGPQGYTHLPAGLQHLILKSAPLRWPEGSRGAAAWNSRFWKRVRYLMPATPAKRCPQSAII
ncbi:interleukin-1 receptor-like 1 [Anoplopoma fimbria]|uniref:interleukin-1 receptor-like 1 n=1 Tax=Anoplopoma fimbria TaxID=229290 RepID=UPI0023EB2C19|nr:interleukin-1 receptor-like 1 [Anoplopoma fimbria]